MPHPGWHRPGTRGMGLISQGNTRDNKKREQHQHAESRVGGGRVPGVAAPCSTGRRCVSLILHKKALLSLWACLVRQHGKGRDVPIGRVRVCLGIGAGKHSHDPDMPSGAPRPHGAPETVFASPRYQRPLSTSEDPQACVCNA